MPKGIYQRKPTHKQLRSLYLVLPGPLGLGISMREASERLGLASSCITQQLSRFKKNYPKAWEQVECMLNTMYRQGRNLGKPITTNRVGWRFLENRVIEKF